MAGERGHLSFNFVLSIDAQAGDQVDDLRDQIEALGHSFAVTRGEFKPPPTYNLFSDGVSEVMRDIPRMLQMGRSGYQLVTLVTEAPTLVSSEGLAWNYMMTPSWEARAEAFVAMAPALTAAWCYVPGAARVLRRFVRRTADIDMAWGPRFDSFRDTIAPRTDFCFYGGLTWRRQKVIDQIKARGCSVDVIHHSTSLADRDLRLQHSKVVLDIKQYHWWDLCSSARYTTALWHGRPVVAEWRPRAVRASWEEAVRFARHDLFVETAVHALRTWRELYRKQIAAIKKRPDTVKAAIAALPMPGAGKGLPAVTLGAASTQPQTAVQAPLRPSTFVPRLLDSQPGINYVEWQQWIFAIPHRLGKIEIDKTDLARFPAIKKYANLQAAKQAMRGR
jgi:hypothetical protein